MPRIDDYRNARWLAVEKLARESFDTGRMAALSYAVPNPSLEIPPPLCYS